MPAELHVVRGVQFGERLAVPPLSDGGRVVVGRDAEAQVRLIGPQVSRRHFAIERGPGSSFRLLDLGSGNGTFVNGRRVSESPLADGDRIAVGDVECRFVCPEAGPADRTVLRIEETEGAAPGEIVAEGVAAERAAAGPDAVPPARLAELAAVCAEETRADRLCHRVLEICREALEATRGAILLQAAAGEFLETVAVHRAPDDPPEVRLAAPRAFLARVAARGRAVRIRVAGPRAESALVVAIGAPGGAGGVLYLGRSVPPGPDYADRDLSAAAALATIAAGALARVRAGLAREGEDARIRLLVEGSPDLLFALDDEGRFTYANRRLPGLVEGREALLGTRLTDLVPAPDREGLLDSVDRVLEGPVGPVSDAREVVETSLRRPGGGTVPVRLYLSPLRNALGTIVGVGGVARDHREVLSLREAASAGAPGAPPEETPPGTRLPGTEAIVGKSPAMREVLRQIEKARGQDYPVLIVGETGTGKELVARALHAASPRASGPFVAVNCAALPETLLEAELFGHTRGAFTGAHERRRGLVASADGGTLFLDEIGEMGAAMQARLLRVLEEHEVRPVGEDRGHPVDVRIVTATHRDLAALAQAGSFRQDLLYRLDVVRIALPPLRERPDDVPHLVAHALKLVAAEGGPRKRVSGEAAARLARYEWPGNVRELLNEIRRATVAAAGAEILPEDLSPGVRDAGSGVRAAPAAPGAARTLRSVEREAIEQALRAAGGNRKRAAGLLGIPRTTLYRRLREYGLLGPAEEGSG